MFNINKLVDIERKALETTYCDTVTVTRNEEITEGNITKNKKIEVLKDEPCALSITRENGENIIAVAGKPSFHTTHYEISLLIQERA